jgi:gluconate 2-dehydrogenase alpha chain
MLGFPGLPATYADKINEYCDKRYTAAPQGIVVLSSFVFSNTQQLLLAGIGEPYDRATGRGVVGKNYAYQFEAPGEAFFEDKELNSFMGMSMSIDDFNGENLDHSGLGFFAGGYILCG